MKERESNWRLLCLFSLPWMTPRCSRGPQRTLLLTPRLLSRTTTNFVASLSQQQHVSRSQIWLTQWFSPGFLLIVCRTKPDRVTDILYPKAKKIERRLLPSWASCYCTFTSGRSCSLRSNLWVAIGQGSISLLSDLSLTPEELRSLHSQLRVEYQQTAIDCERRCATKLTWQDKRKEKDTTYSLPLWRFPTKFDAIVATFVG